MSKFHMTGGEEGQSKAGELGRGRVGTTILILILFLLRAFKL
jgi:hypothetical protein